MRYEGCAKEEHVAQACLRVVAETTHAELSQGEEVLVLQGLDGPGREITVVDYRLFLSLFVATKDDEGDTKQEETLDKDDDEHLDVGDSLLQEQDVERCAIEEGHPVECFDQQGKA